MDQQFGAANSMQSRSDESPMTGSYLDSMRGTPPFGIMDTQQAALSEPAATGFGSYTDRFAGDPSSGNEPTNIRNEGDAVNQAPWQLDQSADTAPPFDARGNRPVASYASKDEMPLMGSDLDYLKGMTPPFESMDDLWAASSEPAAPAFVSYEYNE
jgi:hypothetical protein